MKVISDDTFLTWAAEVGLEPDERYTAPRQLVFPSSYESQLVWELPSDAAHLVRFVRAALSAASETGEYRFRLRGGGFWTSEASPDDSEFNRIVRAFKIPENVAGALEFSAEETETAVGLAVASAIHGVSVATDLEIVPAERRVCLMMSHHNEMTAHFPAPADLDQFQARLEEAGYRTDDDELALQETEH